MYRVSTKEVDISKFYSKNNGIYDILFHRETSIIKTFGSIICFIVSQRAKNCSLNNTSMIGTRNLKQQDVSVKIERNYRRLSISEDHFEDVCAITSIRKADQNLQIPYQAVWKILQKQ